MNCYSVVPNKDTSGWYVKLENAAPTELYSTKSMAITQAEEMARENRPSKVQIFDKDHNVEDEKNYQ